MKRSAESEGHHCKGGESQEKGKKSPGDPALTIIGGGRIWEKGRWETEKEKALQGETEVTEVTTKNDDSEFSFEEKQSGRRPSLKKEKGQWGEKRLNEGRPHEMKKATRFKAKNAADEKRNSPPPAVKKAGTSLSKSKK